MGYGASTGAADVLPPPDAPFLHVDEPYIREHVEVVGQISQFGPTSMVFCKRERQLVWLQIM